MSRPHNILGSIVGFGLTLIAAFCVFSVADAAQITFTTDYYGGTNAIYTYGDTDLSDGACNAIGSPTVNTGVPICIDLSHSISAPVYSRNVYDVSDLTVPVINSYYSSWNGVLADGEYYAIVSNNGGGAHDCGGSESISDCIAAQSGGGVYQTTVDICVTGGGTVMAEGPCAGGGGGATTTATTTPMTEVDNPVANIFYGFILFLAWCYFPIWFFKKR